MTKEQKIINELKEEFIKAYASINAENLLYKDSMKKHKEEASRLNEQARAESLKKIQGTRKENILKADIQIQEAIKKASELFIESINMKYLPNGENINESEAKLLKYGILNQTESEALATKYKDNYTMLRLIENYMADKGFKPNSSVKAYFDNCHESGKKERYIFDNFLALAYNPIRIANQGLSDSEAYSNATNRFDSIYNQAFLELGNTEE